MYLTLLGILTEDKFLQLENTHPPIVSTLSPSSTVFRQDNLSFSFANAFISIFIALLGNLTEDNFLQFAW